MRELINIDYLCILRYEINSNEIVVDFVPIENFFTDELKIMNDLCINPSNTLEDIVSFLSNTSSLTKLNGNYRYCTKLSAAYQGFSVDIQRTIKSIENTIELNKTTILDSSNLNETNEECDSMFSKSNFYKSFSLWINAYNINLAYKKCILDKSILTFSHRIRGWSNPVYSLNTTFSIELKTNFGYGNSSYFYLIIVYKNISITPFSDWVNYEIAKFSEIIRYSKCFNRYEYRRGYCKTIIENFYWEEALLYAKDACNLSLSDENEFVNKYLLIECENMVNKLEEILTNEKFEFESPETKTYYDVDKKGRILIDFRGEKISGALDFISKMIEYKQIINTSSFIERIEKCNIQIKPYLAKELPLIEVELDNLDKERILFEPIYKKYLDEKEKFDDKRNEIKLTMFSKEQIESGAIDIFKFENIFRIEYPAYPKFIAEFMQVSKDFDELNQKIENLRIVQNNIISYINKISEYFKNEKA